MDRIPKIVAAKAARKVIHRHEKAASKAREAGDQVAMSRSLSAAKRARERLMTHLGESERLDELSKKTLSSYIKKAVDDVDHAKVTSVLRQRAGENTKSKKNRDYYLDSATHYFKKGEKRKTGIAQAVGKIVNEAIKHSYNRKEDGEDHDHDFKDDNLKTVFTKHKDASHDWVNKEPKETFGSRKALERRLDRSHGLENLHKVRYDGGAAEDAIGYHHKKGHIVAVTHLDTHHLLEAEEMTNKTNLQELSKKTLGSYIKKASLASSANHKQAGSVNVKTVLTAKGAEDAEKGFKLADKYSIKGEKRQRGLNKAVSKLVKEAVLNELSKDTMASYIKKRVHSVANAAHDVGSAHASSDAKFKKGLKVVSKGQKGIRRAVNKLSEADLNEEFQKTHRVGVTLSEPDATLVQNRKAQFQKFIKLSAKDDKSAVEKAHTFYKKSGYKVHPEHTFIHSRNKMGSWH